MSEETWERADEEAMKNQIIRLEEQNQHLQAEVKRLRSAALPFIESFHEKVAECHEAQRLARWLYMALVEHGLIPCNFEAPRWLFAPPEDSR